MRHRHRRENPIAHEATRCYCTAMHDLTLSLRRILPSLSAAGALALTGVQLGCSSGSPAAPEKPAKPAPEAPAAKPTKRPPFPNMAGPEWGRAVLDQQAAAVADQPALTDVPKALREVSALLYAADESSAEKAIALAARAWRVAKTAGQQSEAAALLGAAMALNPSTKDVRARLTDAHGLGAWAAGNGEQQVVQPARMVIAAASGRVHDARQLAESISLTPQGVKGDALHLSVRAAMLMGERDDALLRKARVVLSEHPEAVAVRRGLVRILNEFHAPSGVLKAAGDSKDPVVQAWARWADVVLGDTKALGAFDALTKDVSEVERGEIRFAHVQAALDAGQPLSDKALAELRGAKGWRGEAAVIDAELALKAGNHEVAAKAVAPVRRFASTPGLGARIAWLEAALCAHKQDVECTQRAGARATNVDGDEARIARLVASAIPANAKGDQAEQRKAALFSAAQLSPFGKLPAGVKSCGTNLKAKAALRAARAALQVGAKREAGRLATDGLQSATSCGPLALIATASIADVDKRAAAVDRVLEKHVNQLAVGDRLVAIALSERSTAATALKRLSKDKNPIVRKRASDALEKGAKVGAGGDEHGHHH